MGRFESPMQVVGLFFAASVVSVGVIFFLNAEAQSRLAAKSTSSSPHPQLPEPAYLIESGGADDINKNRLGAAINEETSFLEAGSLSASPSELKEAATPTLSNSSELAMGVSPALSSPASLIARGTNVTLLNFLEDGLEKLLSLIKQVRSTYKSYNLKHTFLHQQNDISSSTVSELLTLTESPGESQDNFDDNHISLGGRHPPRRRKREVEIRRRRGVSSRPRRAAISPPNSSKRRRVGGNEPYYWQMLEDNNNENYHHHHNQKELSSGGQQHSNYHHYHSSKYHQRQQEQHQQRQPGQQQHLHHNFQPGGDKSHKLYSSPGEPSPAVASAFTGGRSDESFVSGGGGSMSDNGNPNNNNNHDRSPTSDFHKIRHAMNKLGGGGLDISVVERMILDTKSVNRARPPPAHATQSNNYHNHNHHNPSSYHKLEHLPQSGRINQAVIEQHSGRLHNRNRDNSNDDESIAPDKEHALPPSTSLLTTATTKTTHPGRQDESLYVNQLRHQQQQLAQSLLPPTVTWLNNNNNGKQVLERSNAPRTGDDDDGTDNDEDDHFLPLPSSSLPTGFNDNGANDHNEEENSVDAYSKKGRPSSARKRGKKTRMKHVQQGTTELLNKINNNNNNNNELVYSHSGRQSSLIESEDNSDELDSGSGEDYPFPETTKGEEDSSKGDTSSSEEEEVTPPDEGDDSTSQEKKTSGASDTNNNDYDNSSDGRKRNISEDEDESGNEDEEEEEEEENDEPLPSLPPHNHESSNGGKDCYRTDDVLIVVAITCCLNFAFVLVIWALVRWFSISGNPKEKDFQNLGDCDDTLDPTIVFHGVTEDPCWTLATKEAASSAGTAGGAVLSGRALGGGSGGVGGGSGAIGVGFLGTIGSIHSTKKLDLFPGAVKHRGGGVGVSGASSSGTIGASVMTMTADRRGLYHQNLSHYYGGGTMMSGGGAGSYSFRPEHVVQPSGTSGSPGGMRRSYSQSMEDLRYLQ